MIDISSNFQPSKTMFHLRKVRVQNIPMFVNILLQNVSWDDSNCVLICKKCHKNTYHDDMKCHMTLNTIFIFAKFGLVYFLEFWFWVGNLEKWMGWFWTNSWFSPFIGWKSQLDFFVFPTPTIGDVVKIYLASLLLTHTTIRC